MTDFHDALGDIFGSRKPPTKPTPRPTAEKGVQIHGRDIDGTYYVRAEDVVALLEANSVLPRISARLRQAVER